ncbi:MAG: hypothetical protein M1831_001566 [Alyxoria varia]|nr:MAG: hypothetical protein M1831_001566 [Alyxoria varia]
MPRPSNRDEALSHLKSIVSNGKPLVGAGAGIGLTAKALDTSNPPVSLILVYNSGKYRLAGLGSLAGLMAYSNANDLVLELARDTLPQVHETPVLAGICATDPTRHIPTFLKQLKDMGFAGIQNFPTVGLVDKGSDLRNGLEETGMGYDKEVEMVKNAGELGLLTTPYVFDVEEAERMAKAGADVIVAHMGLTTGASQGSPMGSTGKTLDECVDLIKSMQDSARRIKSEVLFLCHGGPIALPKDAQYVMERVPGLQGFYGASSIERGPIESAIRNIAGQDGFGGLKVNQA